MRMEMRMGMGMRRRRDNKLLRRPCDDGSISGLGHAELAVCEEIRGDGAMRAVSKVVHIAEETQNVWLGGQSGYVSVRTRNGTWAVQW